MTIRRRLTLWYAILLTLIIIIFAAITFGMMRYTMINNIDTTLKDTEAIIRGATEVFDARMFNNGDTDIELPELNNFQASGVYVQAWSVSQDSELMLRSSSDNVSDFSVPLDSSTLDRGEANITTVRFEGVDLRVLTRPIIANEQIIGYIQVAGDLSMVNGAIRQLLIVMLVSCAFAIAGAGALSMWFSHRALKPIDDITQAAASIADTDDLSTRLDWAGPADELGRLISVFNQMMARIEQLFSVQQRFVADVSHELRTPLTSIQGNLEIGRRYGMDDEAMEAMESETKRMTRLVNELLMLARTDSGGLKIDTYPLDLDTMIMEVYEQAKGLVNGRDLTVTLERFEPVRVKGNADRIKQLLLNLISNAVKFTDDGGQIMIGLENIRGYAVIWVKDTGIGISDRDVHRVFDRFFQSDLARTYQGEGFGLGLSIAKWIVEAHEGTIRVNSAEGEGTTFTVMLPVYPPTHNTHTQPTLTRIPALKQGDKAHHHSGKRKITRELSIIKQNQNGKHSDSS
jgi:two-component system, OmpR family, sensor kinase